MQLACPSCRTFFYVDPNALGSGGRNVRCARCRSVWFATPQELEPEPLPEPVFAPAVVDGATAEAAPTPVVPPLPFARVEGAADDTVVVDVQSPPLAPGAAGAAEAPMRLAEQKRLDTKAAPPPSPRKSQLQQEQARVRMFALAVILAGIVMVAIVMRESLVRSVPQIAGLYAAVGLPVNLRGLEIHNVRVSNETLEGIPVLVVEGEVVNVTRQPVELPRLRLAVVGADGRELYSWSAQLPSSVLPENDRILFRSRLASPPEQGREVLVRFLNRNDLIANEP